MHEPPVQTADRRRDESHTFMFPPRITKYSETHTEKSSNERRGRSDGSGKKREKDNGDRVSLWNRS